MNINIPRDSQKWLFDTAARPADADGAMWSFRFLPSFNRTPFEPGDGITFRFDGVLVARARIHEIRKPGDLDTFCHNGKRFQSVQSGHKVVWLWQDFEDLRGKPELVRRIEVILNDGRRDLRRLRRERS